MSSIKYIKINLLRIKYKGDSIGDDIRVEAEASGKFLSIDRTIKVGTTAEINREIGRFETDQETFQTKISLTVIEKDLLFNDVSNKKENIKINTKDAGQQLFNFEIQVRETRSIIDKFWGTKLAIFEIILEAKISEMMQCVPDQEDGWLKAKLQKNKFTINLPAFLKVKIESNDKKREYVTILEGPYRGEKASVALKENGSSQFISIIEYEPTVNVTYSISKKIVTLNGKSYKATDHPKTPWEKGLYDIEIPDYPHRSGLAYLRDAPKARTWFRIGHNGERYLHVGSRSLGCMTVIETTRWDEIYNLLIKSRKGDFISVGTLEVID